MPAPSKRLLAFAALLATVACAEGGPTVTLDFSISGTVSGLDGTLVLQSNGADDLTITSDGPFTFATRITTGSAYTITVLTQPAAQTCTVANGVGTMGGVNVTGVTVTCTTDSYSVGGTVSGLAGVGCVLQLNGGDDLTLTSNGAFTFPTPVLSGTPYAVTVLTQPTGPTQTCTVSSGAGTVGVGDVTSVGVSCTVDQPDCATALYLGPLSGDTGTGSLSATGAGEAWFRVRLTEDNAAAQYLAASVTLAVPAGVDYDLYVYCGSCGGTLAGSSLTRAGGVTEEVVVRWDDDYLPSEDDTGDIFIRVRYYNGSSAAPWSLQVNANVAATTVTCNF